MFGETTVVRGDSFQPTKTRKQKLLDKRKRRQMTSEAAVGPEKTQQRNDAPLESEKEHSTKPTAVDPVHDVASITTPSVDDALKATSRPLVTAEGHPQRTVTKSVSPGRAPTTTVSAPKMVLPTPCVGGGAKHVGKAHGTPSTPPRVHRSKPSPPVGEVWPNVWDNARIAPSYYRIPEKHAPSVTSKEIETPSTGRDDEERVASDRSPEVGKEEELVIPVKEEEEDVVAATTHSSSMVTSTVDILLEEIVESGRSLPTVAPPTIPPPPPPVVAPSNVSTVQAGTSPISDSEWGKTMLLINASVQTESPITPNIKQRTTETQTDEVLTMESSTDTPPNPFMPPLPQAGLSSSLTPSGSGGVLTMEGGLSSLLPDFPSIAGPPPGLSGRADAAGFPSSMTVQAGTSLTPPGAGGGVGYYDPMRVYSTMLSLQQQLQQQQPTPSVAQPQLQQQQPNFWAATNTPPSSGTLIGGPPLATGTTRDEQPQAQDQRMLDRAGRSPVQQQSSNTGSAATGISAHQAYRGSSRYDANRSGSIAYQQYEQGPPPSQGDPSYPLEQHYYRRQGGKYRTGRDASGRY